jgi:hypothetical protein
MVPPHVQDGYSVVRLGSHTIWTDCHSKPLWLAKSESYIHLGTWAKIRWSGLPKENLGVVIRKRRERCCKAKRYVLCLDTEALLTIINHSLLGHYTVGLFPLSHRICSVVKYMFYLAASSHLQGKQPSIPWLSLARHFQTPHFLGSFPGCWAVFRSGTQMWLPIKPARCSCHFSWAMKQLEEAFPF